MIGKSTFEVNGKGYMVVMKIENCIAQHFEGFLEEVVCVTLQLIETR